MKIMKTIEIEDDVYAHLLQNAEKIGESASEILRRLLEIPPPEEKTKNNVPYNNLYSFTSSTSCS